MTDIEKAIDYCKFRINYFKAKRKPLSYDKFDQKFCDRCTTKIYRYNLIIEALKEKAERENPKPLTIEELRQIDGESVWIVILDGSEPTKCEIISEICTEGIKLVSTDDLHDYASFGLYGITWLAYRYEPNHIGEANGKVKKKKENANDKLEKWLKGLR